MRRRAFNVLSAASLGLCLLAAANWEYSYRTCHSLGYGRADDVVCTATTALGEVQVGYAYAGPVPGIAGFHHIECTTEEYQWGTLKHALDRAPIRHQLFGFRVYYGDPRDTRAKYGLLVIPFWSLVVLTAILPAGWLCSPPGPRPKPGFCRKCDYNLTGNDSGICPECGTPIQAQT